jgi:transposase
VIGCADEVWWRRWAPPALPAWTDSQPLRLAPQAADTHDPDPKALAGDGVWRAATHAMRLRFVDGRPISHVTTQYLGWLAERLADDGQQALIVIWDNASWHTSREVRRWLKAPNQRVKRAGGGRLLTCQLPSQSPWLNRIEPTWVHGKRAITEPTRKLTGEETRQRICAYYPCELLAPLAQKVA